MQPRFLLKSRRIALAALLASLTLAGYGAEIKWRHLSSKKGDLPAPNAGKEQTSSLILDIDKDGTNDFVITERTKAPSVVWYRRTANGWNRCVLEAQPLHIEAGSCYMDADGDGDLDVIAGGDWASKEVWWWENPYPKFETSTPWKRRVIKSFGSPKHHDQMAGDFDGDGKDDLVFWNQDAHKLYLAKVPQNPREASGWECTEIYSYSADGEMQQRGTYPGFKAINEHEGLAKADIDGDGKLDIVAGGRWFKHLG
ncbi:MAG TPA: FG-GAP-like repeat-containing protein, partial [Clostridia bacterium]|nr:FG-GAP-like repeat-containing protein [Clostridia bacterium]